MKFAIIAVLLFTSSCYSARIESREEKRHKAIERLDESEKNTEELFREME